MEYMGHGARQELAKAQDAAAADPSEVNLRRLEDAKNMVSIYDALGSFGRTAAGTYLLGGLKKQRQDTRPDISAADSERMAIDQELQRQTALPPPAPPPATRTIVRGGGSDPKQGTVRKWLLALEAAGVRFIDADDHDGPGVRLRVTKGKR
jgi:hypothetical protein